jgi:predicted N-formylglutamate amidohydrolase
MGHSPFRMINEEAAAPYIIICDHASNVVPPDLVNLGLPAAELQRHIAWDIGAAGVAELLSSRFEAPAVICGTSRLVIDCNRHLTDPSSIPIMSDGTEIPGNANLSPAQRAERAQRFFRPYHDAIDALIEKKRAMGQVPAVFSIHSMTPAMRGNARPWQVAISWHEDQRLSAPMLGLLRRVPGITVGDNQPYALDPAEDYSVPHHAMRHGFAHIQVEFRQDEVATAEGIAVWARLFGNALHAALQQSGL